MCIIDRRELKESLKGQGGFYRRKKTKEFECFYAMNKSNQEREEEKERKVGKKEEIQLANCFFSEV